MLVVGAVFIMIFVAMIIVRILVITIDVLAVFRVAVLGADGSPLPGYSLEDSTIPVDSKRLYSMARWKTKPDLGELVKNDLIYTTDYRRLYATIEQQWFQLDPNSKVSRGQSPLAILRGKSL